MIVAVIALVASFGGAALAINKGAVKSKHIAKKAVKSKHIAKNAVKSKQLAAGAVTTQKIASEAVTGDKIDEGSLGPVPALEGFDLIPFTRVAPSATAATDDAAQAAATRIPLYAKGSFSIYGKCFKDVGTPANPGVYAGIFLEAGPGAVFDSAGGSNSSNEFLEPGAPEDERELLRVNSFAGAGDPGTLNISGGDDSDFWAAQGDGYLEGGVFVGTKVGSPEAGDGVFGPGDACLFGGRVASG
jgi:hypothetical protein